MASLTPLMIFKNENRQHVTSRTRLQLSKGLVKTLNLRLSCFASPFLCVTPSSSFALIT